MRVISRRRLLDFWSVEHAAQRPLQHWYKVTKAARWATYADARRTFGHADQVRVRSGNTVTVFNIGGNNYRLIAAVHYPRPRAQSEGRVYVLRILTHADYGDAHWRDEL